MTLKINQHIGSEYRENEHSDNKTRVPKERLEKKTTSQIPGTLPASAWT